MVIMSCFRLYEPEANSSDPMDEHAEQFGIADSFVFLRPKEERRASLVVEDVRTTAKQANPNISSFCEQYRVTEDKEQRLKNLLTVLRTGGSLKLEERDASDLTKVKGTPVVVSLWLRWSK